MSRSLLTMQTILVLLMPVRPYFRPTMTVGSGQYCQMSLAPLDRQGSCDTMDSGLGSHACRYLPNGTYLVSKSIVYRNRGAWPGHPGDTLDNKVEAHCPVSPSPPFTRFISKASRGREQSFSCENIHLGFKTLTRLLQWLHSSRQGSLPMLP